MGVIRRRGEIWYIDYRANGVRIKEAVGPGKSLAREVLAKREGDVAERRYFPQRIRQKIRFFDFCKKYFENHSKVHKRSWGNDQEAIARFKKQFGDSFLDEISPLKIEEYIALRKAQVKPATVNRDLQILKNMFNKAKEWNFFSGENPVRKVKFLSVDNKRLRFLEKAEIEKLLAICDPRIYPVIVAALNTGMRRGELVGLSWDNVDLAHGIIYVLLTKSNKPREIPISGTLHKVLRALPKTGDKVFDTSNLRKLYDKAVKDAGLKDVNFHTLRHTFASHLAMAGADLKTIQEILGHATFEMTLRYAHLAPGHKRAAVEMLGSRLGVLMPTQKEEPIEACYHNGPNLVPSLPWANSREVSIEQNTLEK